MASTWKQGVVLAGVVFVVYGNSLNGSFHYDDFHSIVDNPHIRDLGESAGFFVDLQSFSSDPAKAMYRPLLVLTYAINHRFGGYEVFGYHLVNLLTHLFCALLVWKTGSLVGLGARGATVAAALFAVHPICTEPVNYISSRSELLAGLGFIGGFYAYVRWRAGTQSASGALSGGRTYLAISLVAYVVGLLSKSVTIALPLVLLVYELRGRAGQAPESSRTLRQLWPYHSLYWLLGFAYLLMVRGMLTTAVGDPVRGLDAQIWTQLKAVVFYLTLLVMPVGLNVEHQFFVSETFWNPATLVCTLLIATALWLGRGLIRQVDALWLAWLGLVLAPTLLIPLNVLVNEHRLYLGLAALVLWPLDSWERWLRNPRFGSFLVLGLCLLSILSVQRNQLWKNELSLWSDAASSAPLMPRAHVHLGNAQQREGQSGAAAKSYQQALRLKPEHRAAATNLGTLYYEAAAGMTDTAFVQRYYRMAAQYYEQALAVDDTYPEALNNLGSVYMMLGRDREAIGVLRRVASRHPNFADAHYNLGQVYFREGDLEASAASFHRALQLGPDHETYAELGRVYVEMRRLEDAATAYREAIGRQDRLGYRHNLGEVLLVLGKAAMASEDRDAGLRALREAQDQFARIDSQTPGGKAAQRLQQLRTLLTR